MIHYRSLQANSFCSPLSTGRSEVRPRRQTADLKLVWSRDYIFFGQDTSSRTDSVSALGDLTLASRPLLRRFAAPKVTPLLRCCSEDTTHALREENRSRTKRGKEEERLKGGVTCGSMGRCMADASEEGPPLEKGSEERGGRGGCLGGGAV